MTSQEGRRCAREAREQACCAAGRWVGTFRVGGAAAVWLLVWFLASRWRLPRICFSKDVKSVEAESTASRKERACCRTGRMTKVNRDLPVSDVGGKMLNAIVLVAMTTARDEC